MNKLPSILFLCLLYVSCSHPLSKCITQHELPSLLNSFTNPACLQSDRLLRKDWQLSPIGRLRLLNGKDNFSTNNLLLPLPTLRCDSSFFPLLCINYRRLSLSSFHHPPLAPTALLRRNKASSSIYPLACALILPKAGKLGSQTILLSRFHKFACSSSSGVAELLLFRHILLVSSHTGHC
ncbi:hypothetical protein HOY80DRAFT_110481 [Tuber brumale]|nr:hypothetical protein HOY80DRAFT_110481 [Tuber brumale]